MAHCYCDFLNLCRIDSIKENVIKSTGMRPRWLSPAQRTKGRQICWELGTYFSSGQTHQYVIQYEMVYLYSLYIQVTLYSLSNLYLGVKMIIYIYTYLYICIYILNNYWKKEAMNLKEHMELFPEKVDARVVRQEWVLG